MRIHRFRLLKSMSLVYSIGLLSLAGCQSVQIESDDSSEELNVRNTSADTSDAQGDNALNVNLATLDEDPPMAHLLPRDPFQFGSSSFLGGSDLTRENDPSITRTAEDQTANLLTRTSALEVFSVRMIGVIEGSKQLGRVAVLTDGENIFHGRQGDIIEGRLKVLEIKKESVSLESLISGRRQVLHLATM